MLLSNPEQNTWTPYTLESGCLLQVISLSQHARVISHIACSPSIVWPYCLCCLLATKQLVKRRSRFFKRKCVLTQDEILVRAQRAKLLRVRFERLDLLMLTHSALCPAFSLPSGRHPAGQDRQALIHLLLVNTSCAWLSFFFSFSRMENCTTFDLGGELCSTPWCEVLGL